ncbi:MAG: ABC transporter permease [Candidatus Uhrbacteria bacterium]|nr:ABC transporter permease [Candidatus Uhrbacteria bacterium]
MVNLLDIQIGFFLAKRQIMRASLWTTGLIVFVMILTFLNLVVVSGILVGLIQGSVNQHHDQYTGDVIISSLTDKKYIENSPGVISMIQAIPEVDRYSARYRSGGTLEANYKLKKETDQPNTAGAQIVGIDPAKEDALTGLSSKVIEGEYLLPSDFDKVLIGSYLLKRFVPVDNPGFAALKDVYPGTVIRLSVNGITREVTVKGVIKSKVGDVGQSLYMVDSQLRSLIGRNDGNVAEIAMKVKPGVNPSDVRDALIRNGADRLGKVQTFEDAQPKFLKDMIQTFSTLGAMLSSIGLVVAAITIFIVIFINAVTRRKYIGILKGIGIHGHVIEISYIFQSIFYAVCGSAIGLIIVYILLVPIFAVHPIDFPFSDGILVAPLGETFFRVGLLVLSTLIAGYIPARMIVRKNTLDSILGRN